MSFKLDADLAWDWEYQKPDIEEEWFKSPNPEIYFSRKELWHSILQAMRGVKYSNLIWLHHYEGYEISEMAEHFAMTEDDIRIAMHSAAKVIRKRKMYRIHGEQYVDQTEQMGV